MMRSRVSLGLYLLACLAGCLLVVSRGWVTEDAFISFRVVDHFVQGYGLRWNIDERVQVFTNPLWLLLHIPFRYLTENLYLVTLLLSFFCTFLAIAVSIRTFAKPHSAIVLTLLVPLMFAKPVLDYSSSGLENPLTFLLFAWFGWTAVRTGGDRRWFLASLAVSLAAVNRLDTLFFFGPALAWLVLSQLREVRWLRLAAGCLPLVLWTIFSLWYFGFPFPNTKYAKLHTGIPRMDYLAQGWRYFQDLWYTDAASVVLLVAGAVAGVFSILTSVGNGGSFRERSSRVAMTFGIFGYCGYVLYVGGDFMSGRFFALPVFAAVWILHARWRERGYWALGPLFLLGLLALGKYYSRRALPAWRGEGFDSARAAGIADEWRVYRRDLAWIDPETGWPRFRHGRTGQVFLDSEKARAENTPDPVVRETVGLFGYEAGPEVHVLDLLGVCDPLLARLPTISPSRWRIGHFGRRVPRGYVAALQGSSEDMDPDLAKYYARLCDLTRGDLYDAKRWRTILAFNFGLYDSHKRAYVRRASRTGHEPVLTLTHRGRGKAQAKIFTMVPGSTPQELKTWTLAPNAAKELRPFPELAAMPGSPFALAAESDSRWVLGRWSALPGEPVPGWNPAMNAFRGGPPLNAGLPARRLLFPLLPRGQGGGPTPVLMNLGTGETQVSLSFTGPNGELVETRTVPLPAMETLVARPFEKTVRLPGVSLLAASADEPVECVGYLMEGQGGLVAGEGFAIAVDWPRGRGSRWLFPWLSDNENYRSSIFLRSLGEQEALLHLTLYRDSEPAQHAEVVVPAMGFVSAEPRQWFPGLGGGSGFCLTLESESTSVYAAWSTDNRRVGQAVPAMPMAALPIPETQDHLSAHVGRGLVFSRLPVGGGFLSVPVLANLGTTSAEVGFALYDRTGGLVFQTEAPWVLDPMRPRPVRVDQLAPRDIGTLWMKATSSGPPIAGVGFVFHYGYELVALPASAVE